MRSLQDEGHRNIAVMIAYQSSSLAIKLKLFPAKPAVVACLVGAFRPMACPFDMPFDGAIAPPFASAAIAGF